jgi:hypothetical protein
VLSLAGSSLEKRGLFVPLYSGGEAHVSLGGRRYILFNASNNLISSTTTRPSHEDKIWRRACHQSS